MNTQEKQKKIADMWLELSENDGSYFEFEASPNDWVKSDGAPSIHNLSHVRVHIPTKQWEPKKLANFIDPVGNSVPPPLFTRAFFEQADELVDMIHTLATLDAWACEKGYKQEFVEGRDGKENWYVSFNTFDRVYIRTQARRYYNPTIIYMTEEGAKLTAKALNSGELVLE